MERAWLLEEMKLSTCGWIKGKEESKDLERQGGVGSHTDV